MVEPNRFGGLINGGYRHGVLTDDGGCLYLLRLCVYDGNRVI